jgi:hypothetical protein
MVNDIFVKMIFVTTYLKKENIFDKWLEWFLVFMRNGSCLFNHVILYDWIMFVDYAKSLSIFISQMMIFHQKSYKCDRLKIWQTITFTWKVTIKHYDDRFVLNPF